MGTRDLFTPHQQRSNHPTELTQCAGVELDSALGYPAVTRQARAEIMCWRMQRAPEWQLRNSVSGKR